jgi:hypothetical protein
MSEETKEQEIKVSEEKDGSATFEVPEGLLPEEDKEEPKAEEQKAQGGEADESDEDHPDDTDAVREARRARRRAKKDYIKKTNQEKDQRLVLLARQNQELMARLAAIEKKSHISDIARLDKAIQDEEARLNYAKAKMREATENSDGQAMIKAQELMYETKDRIEKMRVYKAQAEQQPPAENNQESGQIKLLANSWMDRNAWYDPEGTDPRSRIAKRIDNQLVREGWDPASEDYWDELDARLQEQESRAYTETNDETPRKRGPRSVVTGSERETGGGASRNTFTLSPEQVRAMKDAGLWDDPKKRARMAQKYAEQARQNRS